MSRLRSVSWRPFAIPLRAQFSAAHGTVPVREGVLIRVETADGVVGLGEASPMASYTGETVADVLRRLPAAAEMLLLSHRRGEEATAELPTSGALAFGLETALADANAKRAGLPLWRSLHPGHASPCTTCLIPVNATVAALNAHAAAEDAARAVSAGFGTVKLKVGLDPAMDPARIRMVRAAIGPSVALRLDANGAWGTELAPALLEDARTADVAVVEQPVPAGPGAMAAMAGLARRFAPLRIAADESCRELPDIDAIAAAGLVAVVKPMVSGLAESKRMLARAAVLGVDCIVTTTIDAGVATAAAMHLAALLPEPRLACGLATLSLLDGDVVAGVPEAHGGVVELSEEPGLGVRIDEAALARYATAPWTRIAA